MVESSEGGTIPISQSAPENALPKWVRILNELVREAMAE
jgi:hypothetical protein